MDCVDYAIPGFDCPVCPSCHDGVMNQAEELGIYELDIDCGGPDCDACDQELVAASIGTGTSTFRDQYSYNKLLALAGITDTLNLGPNYPGLKVYPKVINVFGGEDYLKVEANQGFMTQTDGIYVKTIILYIPWPEHNTINEGVNMSNALPAPSYGLCPPVPEGTVLPYLVYKETLIDNPSLLKKCFQSFVDNGQNSTYKVTYREGSIIASSFYAKGNINAGSLKRQNLDGSFETGAFTGIGYKIEYPYVP